MAVNYEEEVKKLYPDAFCCSIDEGYIVCTVLFNDYYQLLTINLSKIPATQEVTAWKSAYELLKELQII